MAVVGLVAVAAMGFGLGTAAWNARSTDPTGPQAQGAVDQVDQTLGWIAAAEWDAAYSSFDQTCANFGLAEFQAAFGPVFDSYGGHALIPPRNEPFAIDEIVLVRGSIDLGGSNDNPLRAELRFAGTQGDAAWRLCGLRIDES